MSIATPTHPGMGGAPVLVSVITVCRNAAATVAGAIESVAVQDHPAIEHIVVDGASSDGTQAIVADRLRAGGRLISEPDRGIYDAMNKGLAAANGEIVAFLNADDAYAGPQILSRITGLLGDRAINAVFADVAFYAGERFDRQIRRYDSGRFSPRRLRWGWMPAHPGMFMRRSVYTGLGGFRDDYQIAGDFELVVRGFTRGLIRYRHWPEVVVRMRPGGASTRNLAARLLINREVVRACRANGLYSNRLMVLSKYPMKLLEFVR